MEYKGNLPRLSEESYCGFVHVSFTATTLRRKKIFTQRKTVDPCIALLKEKSDEFNCECLVYAFMPDHVHLILHGTDDSSNVLKSHNEWKGAAGSAVAEVLKREDVWQKQSYDHVLRKDEYEKGALQNMIKYTLQNPVRAGLAETWQEYPYCGSMIGPYDIRHPYWWDWFYGLRS